MTAHKLDQVYNIISERAAAFESGQIDPKSRTHRLLRDGRAKIAQKLGEESVEVVIEAVSGNKKDVVEESADLLFFLLLMWAERGIQPSKVWQELGDRLGLPENQERARRK